MLGRPKEFDQDEALGKAMDVFWTKGYEATSVQDLLDHMGINRGSMYDTFGDKHALFVEAVGHTGSPRFGDYEDRRYSSTSELPRPHEGAGRYGA